jgi:hypothetical protein
MEEFGFPMSQSPPVIIEPPPPVEREFSPEFKKARKKFGALAEKKIAEAAENSGMGGEKKMEEARRLIDQMKFLEFMP